MVGFLRCSLTFAPGHTVVLHAGRSFDLGLRMRRLFGIPFQGSGWTGGEGPGAAAGWICGL